MENKMITFASNTPDFSEYTKIIMSDQFCVDLETYNGEPGVLKKFFQLIPFIEEWKIEILKIRRSGNFAIKNIVNIKFSNLKELDFANASIQSLQGLSRIYLPLFQKFTLENQNVIKISQLKKVCWNELLNLNFMGCRFLEFKEIQFLNLRNSFKEISLESSSDPCQSVDINWIFKLNITLTESQFWINSKDRIKSKVLSNSIKKRHPSVDLWYWL